MHYVIHLTIALIYSIIYAAIVHVNAPLMEIVSSVPANFMLFSIPFWVVAVAGVVSNAKKSEIVGAFCGLHVLWFVILYMALSSNSPEAGNSWLLYLFASPIGMVAGAITGRYIVRLRSAA